MRFAVYCILLTIVHSVFSKNNVKSLTESLGQEVIEIGVPAKDLEEEPSAEIEDEGNVTSTTLTAGTQKDIKKPTTVSENFRRKVDTSKDEEEAKIEKELAEIYKDNIDYKIDNSEVTKEVTTDTIETEKTKIALRSKQSEFKFQPDLNNKAEVEKFRTSVDNISCVKKVTNLIPEAKPKSNSAATSASDVIFAIITPTMFYLYNKMFVNMHVTAM